ncbi:unnamed protein product [Orchesella dallaii]|uniref:CRAL-TRIO domain-containing protein n=1 Tax=Orchesella dallaii TaxID=48710 RepID=A0ABP1QHA7_9HEXA
MANVGEYDLRSAGVSGKFPRLVRYAERIAEHLAVEIRRLQNEGKNVGSHLFQTFFKSLADQLLPETQDIIRIYSRDRRQYSKELLKLIDKEQLPEKYGGTRI